MRHFLRIPHAHLVPQTVPLSVRCIGTEELRKTECLIRYFQAQLLSIQRFQPVRSTPQCVIFQYSLLRGGPSLMSPQTREQQSFRWRTLTELAPTSRSLRKVTPLRLSSVMGITIATQIIHEGRSGLFKSKVTSEPEALFWAHYFSK